MWASKPTAFTEVMSHDSHYDMVQPTLQPFFLVQELFWGWVRYGDTLRGFLLALHNDMYNADWLLHEINVSFDAFDLFSQFGCAEILPI